MRTTMDVAHSATGGDVHVPLSEITVTDPDMGEMIDCRAAAGRAAAILARRIYGPRGIAPTTRLDSWSHSVMTFQAFVGLPPTAAESRKGINTISGHNVWLYVTN